MRRNMMFQTAAAAAAAMMLTFGAQAQNAPQAAPQAASAMAPPYGMSIGLEDAKKAAAAAVAAVGPAGSNPDVIAIVDTGGHLIYLERMDNAQLASVRIAIDKARAAVLFRRPTKVFKTRCPAGASPFSACMASSPRKAASR